MGLSACLAWGAVLAVAVFQDAPPPGTQPASPPSAPSERTPATSPTTPGTKPPARPSTPPRNRQPNTTPNRSTTPPSSTQPGAPGAPTPPAQDNQGLGPTISGRPPEGPLRRYEPRIWEAKFEANVYFAPRTRGETSPLQLRSVTAWFPMIAQNTWAQTDPSSVRAELFVQGQPVRNMNQRMVWQHQMPHGTAAVGIGVGDVVGQSLRWNISWRVKVWNTALDEAAASAIAWPQEWPAEVRDALLPQPGVESDSPDFAQFVQTVSQGKLRQVTPYVAAKELVRAVLLNFRSVDRTGLYQENGFTRGLIVQGAQSAMQARAGSIHDVAAACTATLRAAGIPARFVVGMTDQPTSTSNATKTRLLSWVEFYLPNVGWIPFDPNSLLSRGNSLPAVNRPWPDFGNWDTLNQRVPLSYTWSCPAPNSSSLPYPAVWSWAGFGYVVPDTGQDAIGLQLVSRGRAQE